jgi:hypothetical protein
MATLLNKNSTSIILAVSILVATSIWGYKKFLISSHSIGEPIDSLNGVIVYFNGPVANVTGRNLTADNYNLGLKFQCVEFVKRYYYQHLNHQMPDSYGHAKDFFDPNLPDGTKNKRRNLMQYTNPGTVKPKVNDLLVFSATPFNEYGHVAIVSEVTADELEIIQQNAGESADTRVIFSLSKEGDKWRIGNQRILGWLRKE